MNFGNQQLNPLPCTTDEQNQNWQTAQNVINNITEITNNLQDQITNIDTNGLSDHKVAVNATDQGNGGADYLAAKISTVATPPDGNAVPVGMIVFGDSVVSLYWQPDDINNFGADANQSLMSIGGVMTWVAANDTVDSYQVLVIGADPTPKYLHDAFCNSYTGNGAYIGGADLLIGTTTVDTAGEKTEQPFVDISAISGWHATEFRILTINANVSSYVTVAALVSALATTLAGDSTFIAAFYTAAERYRSIRGTATTSTLSSASTFPIDHIVVLDSGKDPRSNTSSTSETVTIYNGSGAAQELHLAGDDVIADYNLASTRWESRPRGGTIKGRVKVAIPRASGPAVAQWGRTGEVDLQNRTTGALTGVQIVVDNDNLDATHGFPVDAQVTLDLRYNPPRVIGGTCAAVTALWS